MLKLFSDLIKFSDSSAKLFFPCINCGSLTESAGFLALSRARLFLFPINNVMVDGPSIGGKCSSMCDGCYSGSHQWIHNIVTPVPPWRILSTRSGPRTSVTSFRVARATHRRRLIRSEGRQTIEIATEVHCSRRPVTSETSWLKTLIDYKGAHSDRRAALLL